MAGAARKNGASVSFARMSSFVRSFSASARVCRSPNGPTWYGPRRSCIQAWIFRSSKTCARAPFSRTNTARTSAMTSRSTAQTAGSIPNGPIGTRSAPSRVAARRQEALPQRMPGERLLEEDPPQVGVPVERDAEHVVGLALAPVRARPDAAERRNAGVLLRAASPQHHEDVRRRAADERDGAELDTGVDAGVGRVQVARRQRIVAQHRRDLDEPVAVDVDDDHVVE